MNEIKNYLTKNKSYQLFKPVLYIAFLCCVSQSLGQENLVRNGSFEEYNNCPSFAEGFYIDACKYWTSPTLATPDYMNSCSADVDTWGSLLFSVPQNDYGNQLAHSGQAYSFIAFAQNDENTQPYSEYIQIKLKQKLEYGKCYNLKFFIHNPLSTCVNSFGALFTSNELNLNHDSIIQISPQYQSNLNEYFCDTNNWIEMNYLHISEGTEEYLILGVFTPMNTINIVNYFGENLNGNVDAYFYIDDVSIYENECELPNIFSPNGDGINDYFDLSFLSEQIETVTVLNRWGVVVYASNIDFAWNGNCPDSICSDGVYFYIIEFKNKNKKTGFIQLIR